MARSRSQQLILIVGLGLGAAPIAVGVVHWFTTDDALLFWMATIATFFTAGVLSAAIGRRRGRRAVAVQAALTFGVSTFLGALTAFLLTGTATPGILALSAAIGAALAMTSLCMAWARAS